NGATSAGTELLRVRCAVAAEAYAAWRAKRAAAVEAEHGLDPAKRRSAAQQKKLDAALLPYPADLIAALCGETGALQSQGWSAPPGSREVLYRRRGDALAVGAPAALRPAPVPAVPLALLSLSTASRGTSALPPLARTYPQGRLLHRALASIVGKQMGGDG